MTDLNTVFSREDRDGILQFYAEYEPNFVYFDRYRNFPPHPVQNIFYGDSITANFSLQDLFPGKDMINRGIPGDSPAGLYLRLEDDLFPWQPQRVFLLAGINGINREEGRIILELTALARLIRERGPEVFLCSILPLREGDKWGRFQYMDKIRRVNDALQKYAVENGMGYVDYFTAMLDGTGQLAAEYARPDGTHITAKGYMRMADAVRPYVL